MGAAELHAVHDTGGEGPVVVLGHGLGGDQTQWAPIVERLAPRARVVTFDHAASGRCDPSVYDPRRHGSLLGFADDVAAVCAGLGLRGAVFVGHSMSGMAGALAAAADPGLFSRLVLIGASPRYLDDPDSGYVGGFSQEEVDRLLESVRGDFVRWSAGFAPHVMRNPDRPDLAGEFERSLRRYPPDVAHTVFRAIFTSDVREFMPRVGPPTLLLQATDDPAVPPEVATWLCGAVPDARLEVLPVHGHFPHVVSPDAVASALEPFALGEVA